eukprot:5156707-Pleurochrysis_carterae.AAC.1
MASSSSTHQREAHAIDLILPVFFGERRNVRGAFEDRSGAEIAVRRAKLLTGWRQRTSLRAECRNCRRLFSRIASSSLSSLSRASCLFATRSAVFWVCADTTGDCGRADQWRQGRLHDGSGAQRVPGSSCPLRLEIDRLPSLRNPLREVWAKSAFTWGWQLQLPLG